MSRADVGWHRITRPADRQPLKYINSWRAIPILQKFSGRRKVQMKTDASSETALRNDRNLDSLNGQHISRP
eukprot:s2109_g9.t1